jgi:hypothetical protein
LRSTHKCQFIMKDLLRFFGFNWRAFYLECVFFLWNLLRDISKSEINAYQTHLPFHLCWGSMIPRGYLFCFQVIPDYPEGITEQKGGKIGGNLQTKAHGIRPPQIVNSSLWLDQFLFILLTYNPYTSPYVSFHFWCLWAFNLMW